MSLKTAVVTCLHYQIPMKAKYLRIGFVTIVAAGLALAFLYPGRPVNRLRRGMAAADVEQLIGKPSVVLEGSAGSEWRYSGERWVLQFDDGVLERGHGGKGLAIAD